MALAFEVGDNVVLRYDISADALGNDVQVHKGALGLVTQVFLFSSGTIAGYEVDFTYDGVHFLPYGAVGPVNSEIKVFVQQYDNLHGAIVDALSTWPDVKHVGLWSIVGHMIKVWVTPTEDDGPFYVWLKLSEIWGNEGE